MNFEYIEQTNSRRRTKNNYQYVLSLMFVFSLIFNYYLRSDLLPSGLGYLNYLLSMVFIYFFVKRIYSLNVNALLICVLMSIIIVTNARYSINGNFVLSFINIMTLICPLLLYAVNYSIKSINHKEMLSKAVRYFNILMIITFLLMVLDTLFNDVTIRLLARVSNNYQLYLNKNTYDLMRQPSILGHQLLTKTFFLLFFTFNELLDRISEEKMSSVKRTLYFLVSLLGIVFTGSKSGILLFFLLAGKFYLSKKNYTRIFVGVVFLYFVYQVGGFDTLIERFSSTSITTGRLEGWEHISRAMPRILFFSGYGDSIFSNLRLQFDNQTIVAAFEFPIMGFLYKYGVLFVSIFYYLVFFRVMIIILKQKNYLVFTSYLFFVIDVNSYNQLLFNPDFIYNIVIINFTFLMISYYSKMENMNIVNE